MAVAGDRCFKDSYDLVCDLGRILRALAGPQHECELVASDARKPLVVKTQTFQHTGHVNDCGITRPMAERIVDLLEAGEVDMQDGVSGTRTVRGCREAIQPAQESVPVRKARKLVLQGATLDLAPGALQRLVPGFRQRAGLFEALLQHDVFRHIPIGAEQPVVAFTVAERYRAGVEVANLAIRPDDPERIEEGFPGGDSRIDRRPGSIAVFGMEGLFEQIALIFVGPVAVAEDLHEDGIARDTACLQIRIEHADLGNIECEPQAPGNVVRRNHVEGSAVALAARFARHIHVRPARGVSPETGSSSGTFPSIRIHPDIRVSQGFRRLRNWAKTIVPSGHGPWPDSALR